MKELNLNSDGLNWEFLFLHFTNKMNILYFSLFSADNSGWLQQAHWRVQELQIQRPSAFLLLNKIKTLCSVSSLHPIISHTNLLHDLIEHWSNITEKLSSPNPFIKKKSGTLFVRWPLLRLWIMQKYLCFTKVTFFSFFFLPYSVHLAHH